MKEQKFTQVEFDKLPALISHAEVLAWTGLDGRGLRDAVAAKHIGTYSPRGKYRRYVKADVAKLCGMKV